jgi:drug/metabolite transporter (DMT)-like permease
MNPTLESHDAVATSPLPFLAVVAAVVSWGFGAILVKVMSIDGVSLAFYRLWLGFGLMILVVSVRRRRPTLEALRFAAPGGILFGVNVALFFSAVNHTTIANANLISALQPAIVLLFAGPLFGETVGWRAVSWTGVSIVGVAIAIVGAAGAPEWSPLGDAMAVGAVLLLTGYFLFSKRARASVGTLEYMVCVQFVSALVITPIALFSGHVDPPRGIDWLWMTVIVFGTGTGAHLLINWAHAYVDVSVSSLMMLLVPVVAYVAAWALLDESLTLMQIGGSAIALGAMVVIVHGSRRNRELVLPLPAADAVSAEI